MPSNQMLMYFMGAVIALFVAIIVAYFLIQKKLNKTDLKRIRELREGTKEKNLSMEVLYQKLYVIYKRIPVLKRYTNKLRRKLEIINIDDEYLTRKQVASILTKAFLIILPVTILIIVFAGEDTLLLCILLMFEVFLIETLMSRNGRQIRYKIIKTTS